MANRGTNGRYSGDMDETRIYRDGFPLDQGTAEQPRPNESRNSYYDPNYPTGYDANYDPNYAPGYDAYYDSGYDPNYDPNYSPDYDPNYGSGAGYGGGQGTGGGDGYYDDWDDGYGRSSPRNGSGKMTMAARAAGKQNPDPYSRARQSSSAQQAHRRAQQQVRRGEERAAGYDYDAYEPPRRRRKKKRHGFRNFLIFLLLLLAIFSLVYLALFRAPKRYEDAVHTRKAGMYNILLCATDGGELRTDTIMLATLDQKNSQVSLTTIPRDTIVSNGEWVPKINGVYALAGGGETGAEALMNEVKNLLGFRPDGYAIINYEAFRDVVNTLGGVSFDVPMDMTVSDPDGGEIEIYAGEQVLDGDQALAVCRFRYGYLMADIQRQYVQQNFLKAVVRQCMAPSNWGKLPSVYRSIMQNTITDLSDANIRYLALHAYMAGLGDIEQYTLPGEGVDYNSASCYGLYGQSVVDLVNQVMNPFEEEITLSDVYILTVEYGELVESTWRGDAFDPSTYDYGTYED